MISSIALSRGGPTKYPTLPGSVLHESLTEVSHIDYRKTHVPRAKMTVIALHVPERPFSLVEVPVSLANKAASMVNAEPIALISTE